MALLSWLFPNEKSCRSALVLKACEGSLKGMREARERVESGVTPLDKALYCQPIVSTINVMCGRDGDDRFKPVEIGLLLDAVARFNRASALETIIGMSEKVEAEIVRACLIILGQILDITDEARRAVFRVSEELDTLVSELNIAANAK